MTQLHFLSLLGKHHTQLAKVGAMPTVIEHCMFSWLISAIFFPSSVKSAIDRLERTGDKSHINVTSGVTRIFLLIAVVGKPTVACLLSKYVQTASKEAEVVLEPPQALERPHQE